MGESHYQLLALLVEIHNKYTIGLFQKLFRLLESQERPIITKKQPKDELYYYFSQCAKEDLSDIFERHGYPISVESKKKNKSLD